MSTEPRVVIITCNWNAHESLQQAGRLALRLPKGVRHLKLECLGQIGSATILTAFEKGADGVMLIGCVPEECHYEFGSRRAQDLFRETRELARLLGYGEEQLAFHQVRTGEGAALVKRVQAFVDGLASRDASQEGAPQHGAEGALNR